LVTTTSSVGPAASPARRPAWPALPGPARLDHLRGGVQRVDLGAGPTGGSRPSGVRGRSPVHHPPRLDGADSASRSWKGPGPVVVEGQITPSDPTPSAGEMSARLTPPPPSAPPPGGHPPDRAGSVPGSARTAAAAHPGQARRAARTTPRAGQLPAVPEPIEDVTRLCTVSGTGPGEASGSAAPGRSCSKHHVLGHGLFLRLHQGERPAAPGGLADLVPADPPPSGSHSPCEVSTREPPPATSALASIRSSASRRPANPSGSRSPPS